MGCQKRLTALACRQQHWTGPSPGPWPQLSHKAPTLLHYSVIGRFLTSPGARIVPFFQGWRSDGKCTTAAAAYNNITTRWVLLLCVCAAADHSICLDTHRLELHCRCCKDYVYLEAFDEALLVRVLGHVGIHTAVNAHQEGSHTHLAVQRRRKTMPPRLCCCPAPCRSWRASS